MKKASKIKFFSKWSLPIVVCILITACQKEHIANKSPNSFENLTVSSETAIQIATNFTREAAFHNDIAIAAKNDIRVKGKAAASAGRKPKSTLEIADKNGITALFVIQFEPEGFVVISGSKKEVPILAFSENGTFDYDVAKPADFGITDWIKERVGKIEKIRETPSYKQDEKIKEQWDAYAPPTGTEPITGGGTIYEQKGPLTSTKWGQGAGYNNNAPYKSCTSTTNGRASAGCVAVATAQIMKYWNYPNSYTWSAMPDSTGSDEASRLIYDIGVKVKMNYGCDGSAASVDDVEKVLENFGYSKDAKYVPTTSTAVVNQINNGWPVLMRGNSPNGGTGHAWVCDGYRRNINIVIHNPGTVYEYESSFVSDFYLRMNWGWSGLYNTAWFLYGVYTPGSSNYSSNSKMLINIHK